jgi:hypothetical protein
MERRIFSGPVIGGDLDGRSLCHDGTYFRRAKCKPMALLSLDETLSPNVEIEIETYVYRYGGRWLER